MRVVAMRRRMGVCGRRRGRGWQLVVKPKKEEGQHGDYFYFFFATFLLFCDILFFGVDFLPIQICPYKFAHTKIPTKFLVAIFGSILGRAAPV